MRLWVLILLSLGHLVTDIHQGAIPLMLPYLKEKFELSYFAVGAVVLVTNFSSSIIQPIFGLYSDKVNTPWLLPMGVGLAAAGVALAGIMPSYSLVLMVVLLSGFGIAAYHPEGSKLAHFAAGSKRGSAMSIFSVGGNLGFAIGPILGALFLGKWGLNGTLGFLIPGALMAIVLYLLLPKMMEATNQSRQNWQEQRIANKTNGVKATWSWGLILLMLVVIIRSWIHFGLISYIPLYYESYMGETTFGAATIVAAFLVAGAIGTLLGGPLADKFGVKKQICGSMGLMIPLLYIFFNASEIVGIVAIALAGMALISTFATTVVLGQQYLPHNLGLASGLMLGFAVGAGGIGVPILGLIADHYGLPLVMKIIGLLPILGLCLAVILPAPPAEEITADAHATITEKV